MKTVLHAGSGTPGPDKLPDCFRGDDWTEIRLDADPSVLPHIVASICCMGDLPSDSYDGLFCSHCLEHLPGHQVLMALAEFLRVLRPGGYAILCVPDLLPVARGIIAHGLEIGLYMSPVGPISALDMLYGHLESVAGGNDFMAHKTGFTGATLTAKLRHAGFATVETVNSDVYNLWAKATKG